MDNYEKKYLKAIRESREDLDMLDDDKLLDIINRIYTDGFNDGINDEREEKEG